MPTRDAVALAHSSPCPSIIQKVARVFLLQTYLKHTIIKHYYSCAIVHNHCPLIAINKSYYVLICTI